MSQQVVQQASEESAEYENTNNNNSCGAQREWKQSVSLLQPNNLVIDEEISVFQEGEKERMQVLLMTECAIGMASIIVGAVLMGLYIQDTMASIGYGVWLGIYYMLRGSIKLHMTRCNRRAIKYVSLAWWKLFLFGMIGWPPLWLLAFCGSFAISRCVAGDCNVISLGGYFALNGLLLTLGTIGWFFCYRDASLSDKVRKRWNNQLREAVIEYNNEMI